MRTSEGNRDAANRLRGPQGRGPAKGAAHRAKAKVALLNAAELFAESAEDAAKAGLVYVSDGQPGIRRVRHGHHFAYYAPGKRRIGDPAALNRIARLAIPPAYEDVWICTDPRGHIQATGRDARGRKQYRYHGEWRAQRDGDKFERMVDFGASLPRLRRRLRRDLGRPGLPRDKVLAVVASLLDTTRVRIGNPEYARDNKSFGLTTLRNRHVKFLRERRALLRFPGKGGAQHEVVVDDKRIVRIVRRCQDLPGQLLFQYIDDEGERRPIDSEMVNDYLREAMGGEFTAKDFRTWGATVRAIALMAATPLPERESERAMKACINDVIRQVAQDLRNTPAVCRKSYINPQVFSAWRSGALHKALGDFAPGRPGARGAERFALAFFGGAPRRPAAVRRPTAARIGPLAGRRIPTTIPSAGRHQSAVVAHRLGP
ncbi:MAG: DNA topoisomerase IB [Betaproteobacteria bacterium]